MKRIEAMLNYLEEEMEKTVDAHIQWLEQGEFPEVEEVFQWLSEELKSLEKDCLVISFLRSSYITGSHRFKLAVYEGEPFIEKTPLHKMLPLEFLYQDSNEELNRLMGILKKKFMNITEAEQELIRQHYLEVLYQSSEVLFKRTIESVSENIGKIKIFFGEEMGEIQEIGVF